MKKGFVALLLVLAVIVLLSPGIIGRFAERNMGTNIAWAANEHGEVVVTSVDFAGGWFTSTGQHRVELMQGDLYDWMLLVFGSADTDGLPALLIDTHLDHGLIAVTSMRRENGSLAPGLGSAVSTLSLAFADGTVVALPGKLYSKISLGGALQSRFVLEPGHADPASSRVDWGGAEFLLTVDQNAGSVALLGALNSLAVESEAETLIVGKFDVNLKLTDSGFGFMVGPARVSLDSFAVIGADETKTAGPMYMRSETLVTAGAVDANMTLHIENIPIPMGGSGDIDLVARIENVDAAALGQLRLSLDAAQDFGFNPLVSASVQHDFKRLLASGMQIHFDQMDVSSPLGLVTSSFRASIDRSDASDYSWATALMALDASASISLPAALVDIATEANPDMQGVIAMGFLRKQGQFYTLDAAFKQGLLIVNGAPMPIPLSGLQ